MQIETIIIARKDNCLEISTTISNNAPCINSNVDFSIINGAHNKEYKNVFGFLMSKRLGIKSFSPCRSFEDGGLKNDDITARIEIKSYGKRTSMVGK